jgi:hypothetical protein
MAVKSKIISVQGTEITIIQQNQSDYISLTDMAKAKEGDARAADIIKNWIRTRTTLEFLGTWEQLYNPDFKVVEFDHFKMEAGLPSFVLSVGQWAEKTNAIGIYVQKGRYGATYAHKDIAFEFGAAISAVFRLFLIKEFQRLKEEENNHKHLEWSIQRTIAKINYRIHTDAIKENLVPAILTSQQKSYVYADEADILNVALFGRTAKQWRAENQKSKGNIRDEATIEQLVVLSNLESINSVLIKQQLSQSNRLEKLNQIAISQMRSLLTNPSIKKLK